MGHRLTSRTSCLGVVGLSILVPLGIASTPQSTNSAAPFVLRVSHPSRKAVGLLYTPEVLAKLAEGRAPDAVPKRISDAIRQQTPIVVMWILPPSLFRDSDQDRPASYPRPYRITIAEAGNDPLSPNRIEPIWIQQEDSDLQRLDTRTEFEEVGAVAAFPRSAFVPGRQVFIHSAAYWTSTKTQIDHRIWATIEWNGAGR